VTEGGSLIFFENRVQKKSTNAAKFGPGWCWWRWR